MKASANSAKSERTSRLDWVQAALKLLARDGLKAVTIAKLCKELNLTTGSFYWHFNGRQALLSAMAESWKTIYGKEVLDELRNSELDDRAQLKEINRLSTQAGYGTIDRALRIWAESCPETQAAVREADRNLLDFVSEKLVNIGLSEEDARVLARMAHACAVGMFAVAPSLESRELEQIDLMIQSLIEQHSH
jgi:AcrR family transcriptional regulator